MSTPKPKPNPPDISGTRSRAYNYYLPPDPPNSKIKPPIKPTGSGVKAPTSRMGAITTARKKGGLRGMPINGAGIDYSKGKWFDNTGRVFATSPTEDGKVTPLQKAARTKRLSMRGK